MKTTTEPKELILELWAILCRFENDANDKWKPPHKTSKLSYLEIDQIIDEFYQYLLKK